MRKIIDSNYLQNDALRKYLSKSRHNYAVLTDYAAMEAYKGDTLKSIFKSMSILTYFPQQVIILKGTKHISGMKGRGTGLQKRLINKKDSLDFEGFCTNLKKAEKGNKAIESEILKHGAAANKHMGQLLNDATGMVKTLDHIAELYEKGELKGWRTGKITNPEMAEKIINSVMFLAAELFTKHPNIRNIPSYDSLRHTYIFRNSLCSYLWVINRISDGSYKKLKAEKIRNSLVDFSFITYATFFDGFLSNDAEALRLYRETQRMLKALFP